MKGLLLATLVLFYYFGPSCEEEGFFKVPIEDRAPPERDPNRPPRLVDNPDDPDMRKLKALEEKFFKVAQNTSLSKEFKSFQELLHLIDSSAGQELGRLFFNGILVGMGKEQSGQLFMEFWEEFQFRISPDLADALKDYYDFVQGVDFTLIPMTLQMLFQKDQLGNSLAQMPLGQLVDLIQPEADKYGIDIRGFINGILGKDGSKFPELVDKYLMKMNITNILSAFSTSVMDDKDIVPEVSNQIEDKTPPGRRKEKKTNKILNVFKPFISKLLKDNKVDLDPDAIIKVLTPFVTGGGEMMKSWFKGASDGKGFDFSKLLPLLGMFGGGQGKAKKADSKKSDSGFDMAQLLPLLGMLGKDQGKSKSGNGIDMAQILPLLQGMLGSGQGNSGTEGSKDDSGFDIAQLLPLLGMFEGQGKSGRGSESDKDDLGLGQLANLLPLLGNLGSTTSKSKNGGKEARIFDGDTLSTLASMLGGGDGSDDLSLLMNAATQLLGDKKKKAKSPEGEQENENKMDKVKSAFSKIMNGNKVLNSDIFKKIDELPHLIENIGERFKELGKITKELDDIKNFRNMEEHYEAVIEEENDHSESESKIKIYSDFTRSTEFRDYFRSLILKAKNDTETHYNFKKSIHKIKLSIGNTISMYFNPQLLMTVIPLLKTSLKDHGEGFDAFEKILTFSRRDWYEFLIQLESPEIRNAILESAANPAVNFAKMLSSTSAKDFEHSDKIKGYLNDIFSSVDAKDVTLGNFHEKFYSLALVLTKGYQMPIDLTLLLKPLQGFIKDNFEWCNSVMEASSQLSDLQLKQIIVQSFNDDIVETILLMKRLYELTSLPDVCLPKAICIIMKKMKEDQASHLKKIFITIGSLGIGLSKVKDDVTKNLDVVLASLGTENCETAFETSCPVSESPKTAKKKPAVEKPSETEKPTEKTEGKAETESEATQHDHTEL